MILLSSRFAATALLCTLGGCGGYVVPEEPEAAFKARSVERADGPVMVSASVLGAAESEAWFGAPLADVGIQPVWLTVDNASDSELVLNVLALDPDYFSPSEAAWRSRVGPGNAGMARKVAYFNMEHVPLVIASGASASGFVYTNLDPSYKPLAIELVGDGEAYLFELILPVPGFDSDLSRLEPDAIYGPGAVRDVGLDELRGYLSALACCARGGDGQVPGEPLNLILVGSAEHLLGAFARRGWDVTTIGAPATARVDGRGSQPVPAELLFDRVPDLALHKSRPTSSQRSRIQLWLAPVTASGEQIWVGQAVRDLGTDAAGIDAMVDEARVYAVLDLLNDGSVARGAYVGGVDGSGYQTDGLRAVVFVPGTEHQFHEIDWLEWSDVNVPREP